MKPLHRCQDIPISFFWSDQTVLPTGRANTSSVFINTQCGGIKKVQTDSSPWCPVTMVRINRHEEKYRKFLWIWGKMLFIGKVRQTLVLVTLVKVWSVPLLAKAQWHLVHFFCFHLPAAWRFSASSPEVLEPTLIRTSFNAWYGAQGALEAWDGLFTNVLL